MGRVGWVGNCPLKVLGNRMIVRGGFPIYCLPNQIINASYTTVIYLTLQHIFLPVYILSVQCCTYLLLGDVAGFCLDRVVLLYQSKVFYFRSIQFLKGTLRGYSQTMFTRRGRQVVQKCPLFSTFILQKVSTQGDRWSKNAKILSTQFVNDP